MSSAVVGVALLAAGGWSLAALLAYELARVWREADLDE